MKPIAPCEYPETGVYHPRMKGRISDSAAGLPKAGGSAGTVGVLVMRSYVLAGNAGHYDGVIAALEARGGQAGPAVAAPGAAAAAAVGGRTVIASWASSP